MPARVDPRLPLALLEAVQAQDTPPELLPDERLELAFPQRLGLSGVVLDQVREFRRLVKKRRKVEIDQVEALLELVARRSDAHEIFDATGRSLAGLRFAGVMGRMRRIAWRFPPRVRYYTAARGLRKAHGRFLIAGSLKVASRPFEVRATDTLTARIGGNGTACWLYSGLAAGLVDLSGAGPATIVHPECQAQGDQCCVWRLADVGAG